jgi:hypothetical protein
VAQRLSILDRQAAEGTWEYTMPHDARGTTLMTSADLRALIGRATALARRHGTRGPEAIVAPDIVSFGMARAIRRSPSPPASRSTCSTAGPAPSGGSTRSSDRTRRTRGSRNTPGRERGGRREDGRWAVCRERGPRRAAGASAGSLARFPRRSTTWTDPDGSRRV